MKLGLILSSNDPETAFNALRLANFSTTQGDEVVRPPFGLVQDQLAFVRPFRFRHAMFLPKGE